ncbi:nicotinate-nucleotide--dimethylbenzimidazole phosphoribosyltransferase [Streptomyces sp. XM4193]|uniref:nicotinate-nucleotide--dimethylbenzimidazole phosphoribosyltransferase n=1 Tax=Streptomyces sp. XM4193 TaxID=2929782 RepID=UPI0035AC05AF
MNLDDFGDLIQRPDGSVRRGAEERRERTGLAPSALGRLDELAEWLSAAQSEVPVRPIGRPKLVLFAGDHGVADLDVSGQPAGSAGELVRAHLDGETPAAILARRQGVPTRIVDMSLDCERAGLPAEVTDLRVRHSSGRVDIEDALTLHETEQAVRAGMALADEEADSGTDLVVLGDLSVGGTTIAGILIAALCGTDASVVTGRGGAHIDDLAWMRKCAAIRDGLRRARPAMGDQVELLSAVGGADFAATTGFLLQCSVRRTPVILDGVVSAACALVAHRAAFRAPDWWLAGHASGEPAQLKALDRMGLDPLVDHGVRVGAGAGALLALPLLRSAAELAAQLPVREPESGASTAAGATGASGAAEILEAT